MNGRASACQVYPRRFCAQLCLGLKDELGKRALGSIQAAPMACAEVFRELLEIYEPHPHNDTEHMQYLYSGKEFFDDVHGKWLDKDRAIEARRLELEFFRKMGVYTKVPRAQAGDNKIITTRWIDTDKGDVAC